MTDFESASLSAISRLEPGLLDSVREKLSRELPNRFSGATPGVRSALESFVGGPARRVGTESLRDWRESASPAPGSHELRLPRAALEAIVLTIVRPPLLVRDGTFVEPAEADTVPEVMAAVRAFSREKIDPAIAITGRIEFGNVPGVPFVGTGWIAEKPAANRAIVVTNRHVAREFASADGRGGYPVRLLPNYREYEVRLDLIEEHNVLTATELPLVRVLFIADDRSPDIALLEVEGEALEAIEHPIMMSDETLKPEHKIGVIGYPAYDSRNDPDELRDYFGNIFNVKRFAFGNVTSVTGGVPEFTHDATTLGGNSGSLIIDRETGKAVGLHFAGNYKIANYAVPIDEVKAALAGLRSVSVVSSRAETEAAGDGLSKIATFRGRDGYNPGFLGRAARLAPPDPGEAWSEDLANVKDADSGETVKELKYRHFSVWMSKSRKLPLITAVNIDGSKTKRLGRIDRWFVDERVDVDVQVDNAGYKNNPLDRGHMVRREDPVWGSLDLARQANTDTFHYTNAAPQHEGLNQKNWVRLEDYVLGHARTKGLKVSVFTGPVFLNDDPEYRGIVRIPRSFWKIVAVINADTGKPSVTGYLLSQGELIRDLTGEFVYGGFRTYQMEVAEIGRIARLEVRHLAVHDPYARKRTMEGVTPDVARFRAISGSPDLIL